MIAHPLAKAALLMLVIVSCAIAGWEYYLRSEGFVIGYNDDEALWANNRAMVYAPTDKTTVFIGSSRIKYDLDVETWEKTTGEKAVQLAQGGSNPRVGLVNLGNDEKFKGKLIIDITEGLFFRPEDDEQILSRLKYYKEATPAQHFSAKTDWVLESKFIFLDKSNLSLGALLDQVSIPERKGLDFDAIFPTRFSYINFNRQSIMTKEFVSDTNLQRKVKDIWTNFGGLKRRNVPKGDTLQKVMAEAVAAVAKIKARGGKVIFIRTPSSGGAYREMELINFPRAEYFDQLLLLTKSNGIYFTDYPELKDFICPEWSHLSPADAVLYTKGLIKILEQKNWFTKHN